MKAYKVKLTTIITAENDMLSPDFWDADALLKAIADDCLADVECVELVDPDEICAKTLHTNPKLRRGLLAAIAALRNLSYDKKSTHDHHSPGVKMAIEALSNHPALREVA